MRSVRSTATDVACGSLWVTKREKSPVPLARSSTMARSGKSAISTPCLFHRRSIPYENIRVMKSYLGAMVVNIARIRRISCFSAGIGISSRIVTPWRIVMATDRLPARRFGVRTPGNFRRSASREYFRSWGYRCIHHLHHGVGRHVFRFLKKGHASLIAVVIHLDQIAAPHLLGGDQIR